MSTDNTEKTTLILDNRQLALLTSIVDKEHKLAAEQRDALASKGKWSGSPEDYREWDLQLMLRLLNGLQSRCTKQTSLDVVHNALQVLMTEVDADMTAHMDQLNKQLADPDQRGGITFIGRREPSLQRVREFKAELYSTLNDVDRDRDVCSTAHVIAAAVHSYIGEAVHDGGCSAAMVRAIADFAMYFLSEPIPLQVIKHLVQDDAKPAVV